MLGRQMLFLFQGAMAIFEMMDFYESANRLIVSHNGKLGCRAWIACSKMMKKVKSSYFVRWWSLSIRPSYVYNLEGRTYLLTLLQKGFQGLLDKGNLISC
jgi:hypothetical protein